MTQCGLILLAAGRGTRLGPLAQTLPKAMVDIGGAPLIDRVLDGLQAPDLPKAVVVGHNALPLVSHLAQNRLSVRLVMAPPTGTAVALRGGWRAIDPERHLDVIVTANADTLINLNVLDLVSELHGAGCVVAVSERLDATNFGALLVHDRFIVHTHEGRSKSTTSPPAGSIPVASTGVIAWNKHQLAAVLQAGAPSIEQDLLPLLVAANVARAAPFNDTYCIDCGTPNGLALGRSLFGAPRSSEHFTRRRNHHRM